MEEIQSEEKNQILEGGATRADIPASVLLMTVTTVPIALAGVPMHYPWHGFDTEDASPIQGDRR
ncbi:hypothetical protein E6P09_02905 [Haloferax mediterranei ATCC 33500]|uniref:Uncharacterized protein n=1 Tax=Haloferax mediterranei (strain ATCC 33500 / DSM 1411 / JCM 8866 / NBRC 14739 / NCIMB 2177 / R-4) TaxID=523841 RepID=I3R8U8_HALMT|nr:hypothetical protein HFX_2994 [Haloferax mediterranei ATCC 33500]AHZ22858.1 hypothetical protein BM92_09505 [Haloferax mediterranei ATCC 33500]EMA03022.1 hypothetical protein C439_10575 [Haloferax mediterranei ATCC 33500]QCQ74274.1 hypothetical protein E6P09_02905 [Haloferax mediterranei ATCC 33500]